MISSYPQVAAVLPSPAAAESPCVKVCVIDDDGLCVGCARTLDEIAGWAAWTAGQRSAVMRSLPARHALKILGK